MYRNGIITKNRYKIIVGIFFFLFLCVGIGIFKDYGISHDEWCTKGAGGIVLKYIFLGDKSLLTAPDKDYGPVFDVLLVVIEVILNLSNNPQATFLMRHLVTFLLFYTALFFFYRLCKYIFKSYKIGLLGSLFLILSPRIFADSFYNPKDIPFLSLFIISIYTLIMYLDKKTPAKGFLHALICAILIDIRIAGVIVPILTIVFLLADTLIIKPTKDNIKKSIIPGLLLYVSSLCFFTILFWPTLWRNPLYNFCNALITMSRFPRWGGRVLYLGNSLKDSALPWHYIPVWIIITTPVSYTLCFFIGCFILVKQFLTNPRDFCLNRRYELISIFWFFLPLLTVIVFKSVLYGAWRHLFFIYPAFLIITLFGLTNLFKVLKLKFQRFPYKIINMAILAFIVLNLLNVTKFIVWYHPFQNLYFNILAGKNIQKNFDLDYWGVSSRKALEFILKNDAEKQIKIYATNNSVKLNAFILSAADRVRLIFLEAPVGAKYIISNYQLTEQEYPYKKEYYSLEINGAKVVFVYQL